MKHITLTILLFLVSMMSWSQLEIRDNYGAMLEPNGHILSGAGQSPEAFNNFWNTMNPSHRPTLYMYYIELSKLTNTWYVDLKEKLNAYPNNFIIPQIGLSMTQEAQNGNPPSPYDVEVAMGTYDTQIEHLVTGLQQLGRPAYLRIGYEFNGVTWNDYTPEAYVRAFQKITDSIRDVDLEVATVWCFAVDGIADFSLYYPGDSYVDWCAIDLFSADHFSDTKTIDFTTFAKTVNKPLMIGESTPRYIGVTDGTLDWNDWFVPYFNYINANSGVKAFCYINWDWSQYPRWNTWGDARIEENRYVAEQFNLTVSNSTYLHAGNETTFRNLLHPLDNTIPNWTPNLTVDTSSFPYLLTWNEATDASSIAHYVVYKDAVQVDRTAQTSWYATLGSAGTNASYSIQAVDRAGNTTLLSTPVSISYPDNLQKIRNGSFTASKDFWSLNNYSTEAQSTFTIENEIDFPDPNNAHINITATPTTDWQIFFKQPIYLERGYKYTFSFNVKANINANANFAVQHTRKPDIVFMWNNFSMNTTPNEITFTGTLSTESGFYNVAFALGDTTATDIWLDNITAIEETFSLTVKDIPKLKIIPNPSTHQLFIESKAEEKAVFKIYDLKGRLVQKGRLNKNKVDISSLQSGTYILRVSNKQGKFVKQ